MLNEGPKGDPDGRRLARQRALLLSEASKVCKLLEILLTRAGVDSAVCSSLSKTLAGHEQSQLQKSYGRVEPRKRFKGHASQPLLDSRKVNGLYVDECGISRAEPKAPGTMFFSLGAISMSPENAESYITESNSVKMDFFGHTDLTFHEPYIRHHDGPYYFNGDEGKQIAFDQAINDLVIRSEFVVFGVGVRKYGFITEYVETQKDPYLPTDVYSVAISMLLERYLDYLGQSSEKWIGRTTFESQGPKEDAEHQLEYARLLLEGTQWVPDSAFRNWLETGLRFTPKSGSDPMELADMFSRELYEWIRDDWETTLIRWDIFSDKIYCRDDRMRGKFGVKIFPDSDIRDRIEIHRQQCSLYPKN